MLFLKTVTCAAALVIGSILSFAAPADATTVMFDWTLTGPAPGLGGVPFPGSGTITATEATGGAWDLDTITGEVGGSAITGKTTFFGSDNLVFPDCTTFVDTSGIAFTTATGQRTKRQYLQLFPDRDAPLGQCLRPVRNERFWRGHVHADRGSRTVNL